MRNLKVLCAISAITVFAACGEGPTTPDFTLKPYVRLASSNPPVGSTLQAGQTVELQLSFTQLKLNYPLAIEIALLQDITGAGLGCQLERKEWKENDTIGCQIPIASGHLVAWKQLGGYPLNGKVQIYGGSVREGRKLLADEALLLNYQIP